MTITSRFKDMKSSAIALMFTVSYFLWAELATKYLGGDRHPIILAIPIIVFFAWLIAMFGLVHTPGFMPWTDPQATWDESWQIRQDFLERPLTRLKLIGAFVTLPYYALKALLRWSIYQI